MSNITDQLFEEAKRGIYEILKSDFANKIKKFIFNGIEYKFGEKEIADALPKIQAINLGVLKEVKVNDVDGNEIVMNAEEYAKRNLEGFKQKYDEQTTLEILLEILDKIETFTALANFGSLEMAKKFYLKQIQEEKGITEEGD